MLRSVRNACVVLLLATALVPVGAQEAAAIAYGEDAPEGAYSYAVLLTMTDLPAADGGSRDSSCSGALVAPRWVITAGHCFRDADGVRVSATVAGRTTATIGRTDLSGDAGREVEVVGVRQGDEASDVALAELAEAVTDIAPLQIGTTAPAAGETLRLTGYGLVVDDAGTRSPTWLQTGQFTVQAVGDTVIETAGVAPRAETSPCPHDSGGPYVRELPNGSAELVAVVSSGPGCPHAGWDFSARVDTLRPWIDDVLAGAEVNDDLVLESSMLLLAAGAALSLLLLLATRRRRQRTSADRQDQQRQDQAGGARPERVGGSDQPEQSKVPGSSIHTRPSRSSLLPPGVHRVKQFVGTGAGGAAGAPVGRRAGLAGGAGAAGPLAGRLGTRQCG
ncbi:trypsin-like serine protease [Natronosporangium hydrolyticum]|uniref:Trypsin-like serine protease n=1 Tax=Natronosporangium hydrolyticum TaxID=2811111 RepID=A0A895YRX3_9ACTN|nr:trypsin-like serine protease [Natronosporangium hydrolyticum]QSB16860.1 trypsin-like serine protease [Natronosporangium hydrolyticum]